MPKSAVANLRHDFAPNNRREGTALHEVCAIMRILFLSAEYSKMSRLGIAWLAGALIANGHEVRYAVALRLGRKGLRELIRTFQPDIIGYSIMSHDYPGHVALNRELKREFSFLALFGGIHPTFSPEMIEEDPDCDAVCIGEGEMAFVEFCRRLEGHEAYWETPSFWVRHKGRIHKNTLMPLVHDLDALPPPNHSVVYDGDPFQGSLGGKLFMASRGCPYSCTYCFNVRYRELYPRETPSVRHRSPRAVVDEICSVKARYPLLFTGFPDDNFVLRPPGWIEEFSTLYRERVGVPFGCTGRPEYFTEETIVALKQAGLILVMLAIECGDERVANEVLNRNLSNNLILQAAERTKAHGIRLVLLNMLGMPVENSFEVDLKTLDLNIQMGASSSMANLIYPWPGTPIYQYAVDHGFLSPGKPVNPSVRRNSVFTFQSPLEQRKIENLHKLFDLFVHFPWLRKHCEFICSLPLTWPYLAVYFMRVAYAQTFRQYPARFFLPVGSPREWLSLLYLFLRILRTP